MQQLVDEGLVEDLADLFDLTVDELQKLDRMAQKSSQNLVDAIAAAKKEATLPRLIYGLGIPHVGRTMAGDLAAEFGSVDDLAEADADRLAQMEGVGRTVASAIVQWFDNERNQRLVKRLKERGLDPQAETRGSRLEGKTLVLTGSLDSMTRDEAMEAVRMQGGRATGSVSGETDYLVVGSDPGRTKLEDAEEHGTERVDEATFLELLGRD